MKTLYFMRHAKSSWEDEKTDHKRHLKARGIRDAISVGSEIKKLLPLPQKIWSSDAARAKHTAELVLSALEMPTADLVLDPKLYDFEGAQVLRFIKNRPAEINRVMIVGHNHALTTLVNMLGSERIENLPTAGFVAISFDVENWAAIKSGKTDTIIFPKDLRT